MLNKILKSMIGRISGTSSGGAAGENEAGFTLIETIAAATVFALLMSGLYQGLAVGWRGIKQADAEGRAVAVLQQQLASAGVETPLQLSATSGLTADGVAWQVAITPLAAPPADANTSAGNYAGYWVSVSVRWGNGTPGTERSLQASTLKLKRVS